MAKPYFQAYKSILGFFILTTLLLICSTKALTKFNIDFQVLMIGNLLLLILSLISINFQKKALNNSNPNVFIRSIMKSMIVKMFTMVVTVFIYVEYCDGNYNKKSVFISLILYLIYLGLEVKSMMNLNKSKNG